MTPVSFLVNGELLMHFGGYFFSLWPEELMPEAAVPYLQYEQPRLNALHNTVISQSFPTKRAQLLNIKERQ